MGAQHARSVRRYDSSCPVFGAVRSGDDAAAVLTRAPAEGAECYVGQAVAEGGAVPARRGLSRQARALGTDLCLARRNGDLDG